MNKLQSNPKNVHSSTGTLIVLPGPLSGGDSMFHVPAIPDPSRCEVITSYAKGVAIFEPCVVQFVNRTRDHSAHELSALDRYVEDWAKSIRFATLALQDIALPIRWSEPTAAAPCISISTSCRVGSLA